MVTVRDGLQYIEQAEIAMVLDDAFLPIPKPIARHLWALGEEWEREDRPRVAGHRARRLPPR